MKLNFIFFTVLLGEILFTPPLAAKDLGVENIQKRGTVYCGTNQNSHDLAYKDVDGSWRGFDAAVCRAVAGALLGNKELFEMRPVKIDDVPQALKDGKIDFMLGEFSVPAEMEISSSVMNVDVLYLEKVMFLARKIEGATSLESYKGARICMVRSSIDTYFLNNFTFKYDLGLQPVYYATRDQAIEAFYLDRCTLLPGSSNELKTILATKFKGKDYIELIPEVIGLRPVYVIVEKRSPNLGITLKWILNALRLADSYNITSENLPMMLGDQDPSVQNLLGNQSDLWEKFKIFPTWMRSFIAEEGNFREIYQKYLGPDSAFGLDNYEEEHGLAAPKPFI